MRGGGVSVRSQKLVVAVERSSAMIIRRKDSVMKTYLAKFLTAAVTVGAVLGIAAADLKPRRPATQAFMRNKLVYSQSILEGMALEKYDLVSKNAIRLRDMTTSNLWFTARQPDYLLQTTNYQKSVDALYMAAVDKNLERVTEAYVTVARSCVDCHRLVRLDQHKAAARAK
jgi:hypothetical protein